MTRTPKRPRDPNQLAKMVVDLATEDGSVVVEKKLSSRSAGGIARAAKLTVSERRTIGQKAAKARWEKA